MKKFKSDFKKISALSAFNFISSVGIIIFFVYAFFVGTAALDWLFIEHNGIWELSDHFRQVGFAQELSDIYSRNGYDACFPALAYLYYHFIYMLNPAIVSDDTWLFEGATISYEPILLIMQTITISVILFYLIYKLLDINIEKCLVFTILILFSMPFFAGTLERGNIVYLVLILLMTAVLWKDSPKAWQREMAMVLIAIAAAFKVTPAIFGLLYLKEKRFKEAFRLVIYGLIFFFVPFVFCGGYQGLLDFVYALKMQASGGIPERWTCISGFIYHFLYMKIFGAKTITKIIQYTFLTLMFLGTIITDKKWKEYLYLTNILAFFVISSYRYTIIYLLIPCILLLKDMEYDVKSKMNWVYLFLFSMIFTIPVWWFFGDIEHWTCSVCYLLCLICIIFEIKNFIMKKRTND